MGEDVPRALLRRILSCVLSMQAPDLAFRPGYGSRALNRALQGMSIFLTWATILEALFVPNSK